MMTPKQKQQQFARLERDASSMGTANHGRYISEAMLAMRDPAFSADMAIDEVEAPLRALRLLDAMWGGVHAGRPDQRVALNEVGVWLETRLVREPGAKVKLLLTELGWLKRLSRHHQSMQEDTRRPGFGMPGRGDQKNFGRRLAEIERRRREAFTTTRVEASAATVAKMEPAKPKEPEALPTTLVVQFEDFARVREVRKAAVDREKKKREPKDVPLVLVARGSALARIKLVCSTTRTEGMAEVMDKVRETSGAPDWFMVASGMVREVEGGAVFVARVVVAADGQRSTS